MPKYSVPARLTLFAILLSSCSFVYGQTTPVGFTSLVTSTISTPGAPTLSTGYGCGTGSTTWQYAVVALDPAGGNTAYANSNTVTNGCSSSSSLGAAVYMQLVTQPVAGSASCIIYRVSPATVAKIAKNFPCGGTFYDFGSNTIDLSSPPTTSSTGSISATGVVSAQAFNASGTGAGVDILMAGSPITSVCPTAPPFPPCISSGAEFFLQAPNMIGTSWGVTMPSPYPTVAGALILSAGSLTSSTFYTSTASVSTLTDPTGTPPELATATGSFTNGDLVSISKTSGNVDFVDAGLAVVSGVLATGGTAHTVPISEGAATAINSVGPGLTGQLLTANNAADPSFNSPGVGGRTVSGTNDTILCDSSTAIRDRGAWVSYTSASAVAVTLPQAGSTGCGSNFSFGIKVTGAGTVTITPTTSTIDGNSTLVLTQGQNCTITSYDNVNYVSRCASGQITAGTGITVTANTNGSSVALTTPVTVANGGTGSSNGAVTSVCASSVGSLPASSTVYMGFGTNSATESNEYQPVSLSGTMAALHATIGNGTAPYSVAFHGRYKVARFSPDLSCTISAGGTSCDTSSGGGPITESTNSFVTNWDVEVDTGSGTAASRNYVVCIKVTGAE